MRVAVLVGLSSSVERQVLSGLHDYAAQRGWMVFQYNPPGDLDAIMWEWGPDAMVLSADHPFKQRAELNVRHVVSLGVDRTTGGIPSVCVDDATAGEQVAEHLLAAGLRHFSTFGFGHAEFYLKRKAAFRLAVEKAGGHFVDTGDFEAHHGGRSPFSLNIIPWLQSLPKPCGIMAGCDSWARLLSPYIGRAGFRCPEDIALVGIDNDYLQCELAVPPISSIAVPWRQMGQLAGELLDRQARGRGRKLPKQAVLVKPIGVVRRRSSDFIAVRDETVQAAVQAIHEMAGQPIRVCDVLRRVPTYRHRLERAFRKELGRTIMEEVRRAHVELARRWLASTPLEMPEIARRSGFSNATLLGVAFRKETGMTPTAYRRMMRDSVERD